jgi:hypothetical protein
MSSRRKTSFGSKHRSFIGYTGIEVVSDGGSSSGNYSSQVLNNSSEYYTQGIQRGRVMDDVPSYHSLSISEMQPSIDVSSGQQVSAYLP